MAISVDTEGVGSGEAAGYPDYIKAIESHASEAASNCTVEAEEDSDRDESVRKRKRNDDPSIDAAEESNWSESAYKYKRGGHPGMGAGGDRDSQREYGYNLGLEVTNCYTKYFDHRELELNKLIDSLKLTNTQIKIISDIMNKLAHGKQKDKQADLNSDETAKKCAYLVHLRNSSVFEDKIHGVEAGMTLDQKLQEIIEQLRKDGFSDLEINLPAILDKIDVGHISIDVLSEDEIDVVIQGLDAETKMLAADLNENMMKINNKYEDRSQMTENARQVLKEADEHILSIVHKTAGGR